MCRRYEIDNSQRDLHGALLDAEILAEVYLAMTGGQTTLLLDEVTSAKRNTQRVQAGNKQRNALPVIRANEQELAEHARWVEMLDKSVKGSCIWRRLSE